MKKLSLIIILFLCVGVTACSNETKDVSEEVSGNEAEIEADGEEIDTANEEENATKTTTSGRYSMMEEEKKLEFDINKVNSFEVTSQNLNGAVWDDVITNTKYGENLSPELSWDDVEGANYYYIYMLDESAGNWMHMRVEGFKETDLKAGAFTKEKDDELSAQYVGPYPPGGTHTYTVYVFALKDLSASKEIGNFDNSGYKVENIAGELDISVNSEEGNIIAVGKVSGTYTAK